MARPRDTKKADPVATTVQPSPSQTNSPLLAEGMPTGLPRSYALIAPASTHPSPSLPLLAPAPTSSHHDTTGPLKGHHSTSEPVASSREEMKIALEKMNLPEALRKGLMNADSSVLNALLPLIHQKLAAKMASQSTAASQVPNTRRPKKPAVAAGGRPPSVSENVAATGARKLAPMPEESHETTASALPVDMQRRLSVSSSSSSSSSSTRSNDHRHSHKLAERKRRREMTVLFNDLSELLQIDTRNSSKWQILNEAADMIDQLLAKETHLLSERERLLECIRNQRQNPLRKQGEQ